MNAARKRDKYTFPAFGVIFLIIAAVFLLPMVQQWLLPLFWFAAKTGFILFAFMWVRGTMPRFRYDQLMRFTWKGLFPAAMLNLLVTGFLVAWFS
jgi:NADH-quinone oxidoreductase subunit H